MASLKFLSKEEREKLALEKKKLLLLEQQKFRDVASQPAVLTSKTKETSNDAVSDIPNLPVEVRRKEIDDIKTRYLNPSELILSNRHKHRDKKLQFEWNPQEDTTDQYLESIHKSLFSTSKKDDDYLRKNRKEKHWSEKHLSEMTDRDWRIVKEDFDIATKGGGIPPPLRFWKDSNILSHEMIDLLWKLGYHEPTPIQRQAIPILMRDRDLIGVAETGSGKTLAYLIPLFEHLSLHSEYGSESGNSPRIRALIMAPTRELVLQIERECERLAPFRMQRAYKKAYFSASKSNAVALVGGHSIVEQSMRLSERHIELVIGTPGRLKDAFEQHVYTLDHISFLVLDEADRMVDMGLEEDVHFIVDKLLRRRNTREQPLQIAMFSATMPPVIERMISTFLQRPAIITIGTAGQAVDRIEQRVEIILESQKRNRLLDVLASMELDGPVVIFVNHKETVDSITKHLLSLNYQAIGLHGGKSQDLRESSIAKLKSGAANVLVATDVASRGLDIPNVALVLNYDMSSTIETYIHRIGRTGRAGQSGLAITFLTSQDVAVYYDVKQLLLKSPSSFCPQELLSHEAAQRKSGTIVQKKKSEETIYK